MVHCFGKWFSLLISIYFVSYFLTADGSDSWDSHAMDDLSDSDFRDILDYHAMDNVTDFRVSPFGKSITGDILNKTRQIGADIGEGIFNITGGLGIGKFLKDRIRDIIRTTRTVKYKILNILRGSLPYKLSLGLFKFLWDHRRWFTPPFTAADPDLKRNVIQYIESRGFQAETHYVETEDNYILRLDRIINPYKSNAQSNQYRNSPGGRRVAIIQHGMMGSAINFLFNAPDGDVRESDTGDICDGTNYESSVGRNLGFELSRMGFDVWLPATRGSGLGMNHSEFEPSRPDSPFWRFSFDEMCKHDLPAILEYIKDITGEATVVYIGHGEGALIAFCLLAVFPKYNDFLKPIIALEPVHSMKGFKPKNIIDILKYETVRLMDIAFEGAVLPLNGLMQTLGDCCDLHPILCSLVTLRQFGPNWSEFNNSRLGVYMSPPAQTSWQNIRHFLQLSLDSSGDIKAMDFGQIENEQKYGQSTPPIYDMSKVTNKYIAIYYGTKDAEGIVEAIEKLKKDLGVKELLDEQAFEDYNQIDFVTSINIDKLVHRRIVNVLKKVLCAT